MTTATIHSPAENPPASNEAREREEIAAKFATTLAKVKVVAASLEAAASTAVTTKEQRGTLFNLAKDGQGLVKVIESVRVSLVKPLNDRVKFINDTAKKELQAPLEAAIDKAKAAMKAYDDEVERQQEEARQRLEKERQDRERRQREEAEQIAREAAEKTAKAREEAERERRESIDVMEPGPEKSAAIRAWREKWAAIATEIEEAGIAEVAKAEILGRAEIGDIASAELALDSDIGRGVTKRWTFEVTDIDALYKARPDLVKMEPKTRDINAEVAAGVREIPGIRIYQESSVALR